MWLDQSSTTFMIHTQIPNDSPESKGCGKKKQLRQLPSCLPWEWSQSRIEEMHCAGLRSMWAGDCRVMCMMEYLTHKNASDWPFFPWPCRMSGEHFSLLFVFSTRRFGGDSHEVPLAGSSFETEAKTEARRGGLVSVLLHVYMWIIYLSSSRKWGTITSLGKKSRITNRWYLIPSFISYFLTCFFSPFLDYYIFSCVLHEV